MDAWISSSRSGSRLDIFYADTIRIQMEPAHLPAHGAPFLFRDLLNRLESLQTCADPLSNKRRSLTVSSISSQSSNRGVKSLRKTRWASMCFVATSTLHPSALLLKLLQKAQGKTGGESERSSQGKGLKEE